MKIKRALISVSNKTGVVELARRLQAAGVELISTGGTMKAIKEAGIPVTYVSDVTGFPEIMDGRVKTLNPYIHGGILAVRDNEEHVREMQEHMQGTEDADGKKDRCADRRNPAAGHVGDPGRQSRTARRRPEGAARRARA